LVITETTVLADEHGHEIEKSERKLYTLVELKDGKHIEDEPSDIIESRVGSAYETALNKLREWGYEDSWWTENVLDNDAVELFKACGITVPQKTETIHVTVDGKFQWDEQHKAITKTVTRDDTIWDEWDIEHRTFLLNRRARVDEQAFLRALQWWLAGKDIRDLPALQWGQPTPSRPLAASPRGQRKFDLRSKDARIIREQGLTVTRADQWSWRKAYGVTEIDLDYHYDGLSEQTKADCNELLSDLCHEVISLLRDEMEYRDSEECLLEEAEANERMYDKYGHTA
jgi:hypothetical protein